MPRHRNRSKYQKLYASHIRKIFAPRISSSGLNIQGVHLFLPVWSAFILFALWFFELFCFRLHKNKSLYSCAIVSAFYNLHRFVLFVVFSVISAIFVVRAFSASRIIVWNVCPWQCAVFVWMFFFSSFFFFFAKRDFFFVKNTGWASHLSVWNGRHKWSKIVQLLKQISFLHLQCGLILNEVDDISSRSRLGRWLTRHVRPNRIKTRDCSRTEQIPREGDAGWLSRPVCWDRCPRCEPGPPPAPATSSFLNTGHCVEPSQGGKITQKLTLPTFLLTSCPWREKESGLKVKYKSCQKVNAPSFSMYRLPPRNREGLNSVLLEKIVYIIFLFLACIRPTSQNDLCRQIAISWYSNEACITKSFLVLFKIFQQHLFQLLFCVYGGALSNNLVCVQCLVPFFSPLLKSVWGKIRFHKCFHQIIISLWNHLRIFFSFFASKQFVTIEFKVSTAKDSHFTCLLSWLVGSLWFLCRFIPPPRAASLSLRSDIAQCMWDKLVYNCSCCCLCLTSASNIVLIRTQQQLLPNKST